MQNITVTERDGRTNILENVFVRGSQVTSIGRLTPIQPTVPLENTTCEQEKEKKEVSNFWLAFRNNFECSVLNFKN
jgi:hypothetical protein